MEIALIGLPLSGKSTVFSMLTRGAKSSRHGGKYEYNISRVAVQDERLDNIYELFPRDKKVNITIDFIDMVGLESDEGRGAGGLPEEFINPVRNCDAFVVVLQSPLLKGIKNEAEGSWILTKDLDTIESELLISDLDIVEKRFGKLSREVQLGRREHQREFDAIGRCLEHLNEEKPLRSLELDAGEEKILKGYSFLSRKPLMVLLNISEDEIGVEKYQAFRGEIDNRGLSLIDLCGQIEVELNELEEEDRSEFMESLGMETSGKDKFINMAYRILDLITFYTIGKDEVRAWPIRRGNTALEGAGKIHSDIQRGFIRAEVVKFDDLIKYGSLPEIKKAGRLKSEGKDYIIEDGDIIEFKFNV